MSHWWCRVVETFGSKGHFYTLLFIWNNCTWWSDLYHYVHYPGFFNWHVGCGFTTVFAQIHVTFAIFLKFSHSHNIKIWRMVTECEEVSFQCWPSLCVFADKPRVSLRLGKSLDPDNLRTGNDVYFECDVRANPIPHKLVWLHRVSWDK